jgi:hypothetical protein
MPCPFCGDSTWVIADHIVQPITLGANQNLLLGGNVGYPQIMVISAGCGFTAFLNAVVLKIAPPAEPSATPK